MSNELLDDGRWVADPIGIFHTRAVRPYEAPRQATIGSEIGEILLKPHCLYEQALIGLEEFERIWLIYLFHHNTSHWKPMVQPPRTIGGEKHGLFATRAPYRPNPIGLSCSRLLSIKGLKLVVEGSDLLDGTPILDIKPYIPYADSFPDAVAGWTDHLSEGLYQLSLSPVVQAKIDLLEPLIDMNLREFLEQHLAHLPTNSRHKRVRRAGDSGLWILSLRTWRFLFSPLHKEKRVEVLDLFSGYTSEDLLSGTPDPYGDKELHRRFVELFGEGALPDQFLRHQHR